MKISLFLFLLLNCFGGYSQTNVYHPYPNGWGASWTIHTQDWQGVSNYPTMEWYEDTIINSQIYQKVFVNGTYIGGVRQNIPLEQAYFINAQNNEYSITFDQNSLIGDTIYFAPEADEILSFGHGFIAQDSVLIVSQVDSVLIIGEYRKQFTLQTLDPTSALFIEAYFTVGVGFVGFFVFEYGYNVICHLNENNLLIGDPQNPMCAIGIEESELPKFELYPNPTNNTVRIVSLEDEYTITIIGNSGRSIPRSKYAINKDVIDLTGLPTGLYLIEIKTHDSICTKRIIKQ